jgi:hypothetical protein
VLLLFVRCTADLLPLVFAGVLVAILLRAAGLSAVSRFAARRSPRDGVIKLIALTVAIV